MTFSLLFLKVKGQSSDVFSFQICFSECISVTQSDAAVLQQVTQVVKHGLLVLPADATEVAQEATTTGHHLWEGDFL